MCLPKMLSNRCFFADWIFRCGQICILLRQQRTKNPRNFCELSYYEKFVAPSQFLSKDAGPTMKLHNLPAGTKKSDFCEITKNFGVISRKYPGAKKRLIYEYSI